MVNVAFELGNQTKEELEFSNNIDSLRYDTLLVIGMGGSGVSGDVLSLLSREVSSKNIIVNKSYTVSKKIMDLTPFCLFISYSGNTEETLYALEACQKRRAQLASVTSGGALEKFAKEKGFNCITIPGNQPPRAMFGYSFTQLFFLLNHYGLIDNSFMSEFEKGIALLDSQQEAIKSEAKELATKLYGTTPVIYTAAGFEGVGVRFRQQINENSKK